MTSFWQMTLMNARMTIRNRMALFWLMVFPLLFIFMFGFLVPDGDFTLRVGVVGEDSTPMSGEIVEQMRQFDGFEVFQGDRETELAELADGNRNAVLFLSEGEGETPVAAEIFFDQTNLTTSQVGVGVIQQFLYEAEIGASGQPRLIETIVSGVDADRFDFMNFFVPGILAMALMTNGVIALSTTFVSYRERGILRRLKATPFPLWAFILSKVSVQLVVAMAQAAVLLGTGILLFDVSIAASYVSLVIMIALGALGFLSIGFAVSSFARDAETASGISNVIVFPMMFLGGVFFPVDNAPDWLQPLILVMPVAYLADAFREIVLEGATIFDVWISAAVMILTALLGMLIAVRFFRWDARTV
jgi:ABC-2 type transport system permease protein